MKQLDLKLSCGEYLIKSKNSRHGCLCKSGIMEAFGFEYPPQELSIEISYKRRRGKGWQRVSLFIDKEDYNRVYVTLRGDTSMLMNAASGYLIFNLPFENKSKLSVWVKPSNIIY